jgi:hypothetical protein
MSSIDDDVIYLVPLNDFTIHCPIHYNHATTGTKTPLTTGTVTGMICTSNSSSATEADAALTASLVYVGGNIIATGSPITHPIGTWQFQLDAAALTLSLLDGLFATTTPYLIVKSDNNIRRWKALVYVPNLEADD